VSLPLGAWVSVPWVGGLIIGIWVTVLSRWEPSGVSLVVNVLVVKMPFLMCWSNSL
jgi:hypothetical protein